jgi:hypothetical protein
VRAGDLARSGMAGSHTGFSVPITREDGHVNTSRSRFLRTWRLLAILALLALHLAVAPVTGAAAPITVANGDVAGLIAAITTANGTGQEIHLAANGSYLLTNVDNTDDGPTGLPIIAGNVTIYGNGATIERRQAEGVDEFRIFQVASGTLHLDSVTVSGGWAAEWGGGIYNWGTVTLTTSTVSGNTAAVWGGGIYNGHTLEVTDSTVSDNTARNGGGLSNFGTLALTNSSVSGNTATDGHGGGLSNFGTLALTNSTVSNNTAGYDGGGIANLYGTATLTNSTVRDNTAAGSGGGIYDGDTLEVTDSTVSGNTAGYDGGGIANRYGTATLTTSTVSNNTATDGYGGGITNFGTLALITSTVRDNTTVHNGFFGGGIYNAGTATLTNSTVRDNTARVSGGGIANDDTLEVTNSTVSNNTAPGGVGGGIANRYGTATLTGSTVSGNRATVGSGGIDNWSATLTLNNSTVSNNTAERNRGGGITNAGTLALTNSTVSGNTAGHDGGGISNFGTLALTNSTVSGNTADYDGGGLSNFGTLALTNSTVSNNTAGYHGGGIANRYGTATLTNSTVSNNTATDGYGGGIYDYTSDPYFGFGTVTLTNTLVAANTASTGPDVYGEIKDGGHNLLGNPSDNWGLDHGANGNLVGVDPKLDPAGLQDNGGPTETIALLPGSPAIDTGNDATAPATDQRGVPRPQGAVSDIGAFELEQDAPPAPSQPGAPALAEGFSSPNQGVFDLTWAASDGQGDITYTLERKAESSDDADFAEVASSLTGTVYSFTAEAPEDEGVWVYRVRASVGDVHGASSDVSEPVVVDRTPPVITLITPAQDAVYLLNEAVIAEYSVEDIAAGVASVEGTVLSGELIHTATVGEHTFTVTATDHAGNDAVVAATYKVQYASTGTLVNGEPSGVALEPINADGTSVFRRNQTVTVKFRVGDADGQSIGTPGLVIGLAMIGKTQGTVDGEVHEVTATTPDTEFRWDAEGEQWVFNLSTRYLDAGWTYVYQITLNDGSTIEFQFGLR